MKKKTCLTLNLILAALTVVNCVFYRLFGGLMIKSLASTGFALMGILNLYDAVQSQRASGFPAWMAAALVISMAADVALYVEFMVGAVIFVVGHICYLGAYCALEPLGKKDLGPIAGVMALTITVIVVCFRFESEAMGLLVPVYGVVISCMLGKALSNLLRNRSRTRLILFVGSLLFWFSDLMLAWELFAGGGYIADTACLFTYWPGQAVLGFSMYLYNHEP